MPTRPFDLVRRQLDLIGPPGLVLEDHVEPHQKVLPPCPLGVGVCLSKERARSHVIGLVLLITLRPAKTALQQFNDLCDLAIKVTRHERLLRKVGLDAMVAEIKITKPVVCLALRKAPPNQAAMLNKPGMERTAGKFSNRPRDFTYDVSKADEIHDCLEKVGLVGSRIKSS